MSSRASKIRVALGALTFISGLFFPWYITLVFAVAVSVRYPAWELVGIAVILDLFWMPASLPYAFPYMTLSALALLMVFEPLRKQLLTDS